MSLRYRIALTVFVLEAVMVMTTLWVTTRQSTQAMTGVLERADERLLATIEIPARTALLIEEINIFQDFAEKAVVDPHVAAVVLLDADDRLMGSTDAALRDGSDLSVSANPYEYWSWHSIDGESGHLGRVGIRFSNEVLAQEIARARNSGFKVALAGMVLIAMAGLAIGFLLTRRLERLTTASERFAAGDTDVRVRFNGRDEVSRLGRAFDGMAERISHNIKELKTSEERNRVLVEHCPAAIFVFDPEAFRLVDVNEKWVELLKYPREKIVGMTPLDASPPLQKGGRPTDDWARELVARTFAGENPTAPWILRDADGNDITCELQLAHYPAADRNLIIGIIYDVTERERISQALDQRMAFEDLIVRISARLVGLKPEQVDKGLQGLLGEIGRFAGVDRSYVFEFNEAMTRESCTHEWCAPGIRPAIERLQQLPLGQFPWFMDRIGKGEVLHVPRVSELPSDAVAEREEFEAENIQSVIMVPLVFEGKVSGYLGFDAVRQEVEWPPEIVALLRITGEIVFNALHRKRSEAAIREQARALKQANTDLERSNEELQQFAYVASHDLREPLRAISGFSELLAKKYHGKLDQDADEYIQFMTDAAKRMHGMINDLLSYSRLDRESEPAGPCSTAQILNVVRANLLTAIEETRARITHGELPVVKGDSTQITLLFQNLVSNAIKFHGQDPPQVHIEAVQQDGMWEFAVRDNGIGVDPKHAEAVFQIFRRLHASEKYPGTGIGLAVCRRIVERHGGRIWVERNPEQGSTFFFTLPISA